MANPDCGETRNTISGGTLHGPVLMGRDFRNVHIGDIIQAAPVPVALAQLPPLVVGFTSREAELAQIAALLNPSGDAGAVVVSAVAGLAGVGKTALAVQAAHAARQAGWFPGGVLFLDLHGYDNAPVEPGQALDALLRALGIAAEHIPPDTEERAGLYRSALAQIGDPVLIIADNACSEAQVRLLLPGPGPHRVVVTSRHTLARLGARLLDVKALNEEAGVALLNAALRAARPDDDRIRADQPSTKRLAALCGGLPLALQITAALLAVDPTRTISEQVDELADEHARLKTLRYDDGSGTSAASVAATFELSYRRLDDTTARVFRLLPVSPGPDLSTAAVTVLADLTGGDLRKVVRQLVKAHLIEAAAGATGRWRLHDLLRLYASQLSDVHADADGRDQARDRLLSYYLAISAAADAHLRALPGAAVPPEFTGREDALAWLDAERPSLIAAVQMAAGMGRDQFAQRLPLLLSEYLTWRRRSDDKITVIVISRDTARRLGDRQAEGDALARLGLALREAKRFDEALTVCEDAATIFRDIGDRHGEGAALMNLAIALYEVRRFDEAITACRDAAAFFGDTGDRQRQAMTLNNLGLILREVRRFDEAITVCRDAATIFRDIGDSYHEGVTLGSLGLVLSNVRRFEEAISAHQDAATAYHDAGNRHGEGGALNNLGSDLRHLRRFEEALTAHQDAATIFRDTGDRHGEGGALNNLGLALTKVRRFDEAISACQDAASIFRDVDDRHSQGEVLNNLGVALRDVRRFDEAMTAHRDAVAIYYDTGDRHGEGMALNNLGLALRDVGRFDEAMTAHRDAARILGETGDEHNKQFALGCLDATRVARQATS
jgi:tetratricopeptide (TPR) repeat protein